MGLFPLDAPVDVCIAVVGVGRLPRRGGQAQRRARQGLVVAAHQPRLAHPAGQGVRASTSTRSSRRSSRTRPATRRAILLDDRGYRLRGHGREPLRRHATARISTPPLTASILDGINARAAIQIARDLGYEVVERDIARAELYLADEIFMTGTAAELTPIREVDDHPVGTGEPGEITRAVQTLFEDALHGRAEQLPRVARPGAGPGARPS